MEVSLGGVKECERVRMLAMKPSVRPGTTAGNLPESPARANSLAHTSGRYGLSGVDALSLRAVAGAMGGSTASRARVVVLPGCAGAALGGLEIHANVSDLSRGIRGDDAASVVAVGEGLVLAVPEHDAAALGKAMEVPAETDGAGPGTLRPGTRGKNLRVGTRGSAALSWLGVG